MYFNDHEPYVAAWLRNLYPDATVDERSILDVRADDLRGHRRVHLFAGIGGWQYACELAGWPDDEPIWTASLPCQPFSSAGRNAGVRDERHLWPAVHRLVAECRPPVLAGEQVASKAGRHWLAGVRHDLEELGYAVGAAALPACSVGAPHIRLRLFWVADAQPSGRWAAGIDGRVAAMADRRSNDAMSPPERSASGGLAESEERSCGYGFIRGGPARAGAQAGDRDAMSGRGEPTGGLADATERRLQGPAARGTSGINGLPERPQPSGRARGLGDADGARSQGRDIRGHGAGERLAGPSGLADGGLEHADRGRCEGGGLAQYADERGTSRLLADGSSAWRPWDGAVWLPCLDGKARRVGTHIRGVDARLPGAMAPDGTDQGSDEKVWDIISPLTHGESDRAAKLRALGNSIIPQLAAEFLLAYRETR